MQQPQTETPRIENQFNQPLSISVIFSPLSFPSAVLSFFLFFFSPPLLALGFEMGEPPWGGRGKCGQGSCSREELILSSAAWNPSANHLLSSCNIMLMLLQFSSLAAKSQQMQAEFFFFQQIVFNMWYIIINWKTLSCACWIQIGFFFFFLYLSQKNT